MRIQAVFSIAAKLEALTWAGLLVGMYFKYIPQTTEMGVWIFGRVHGAAFLVYFFVTVVAAIRLQWPRWAMVSALLAAIPPLVTYPLEIWFRRRGLLSASRFGAQRQAV